MPRQMISKLFLIFFLICFSLHANEVDDAIKLFNSEKYDVALEKLLKHSDNPEADYYLGKAYYYGLGVEKDPKKAFVHAKKSADSKFPSGINLLGVLYEHSEAIGKDETKAFLLYNEAANLGDTKAMNNLGWVYSKDSLLKKDIEKARFWFMRSIEYGDNDGYVNLTRLYNNEENYPEALKWILKYEELEPIKFKVSYYFGIGFMYMSLEQYDNAYKYILKATQLGSFEATHNLYGMIRDRHIPKSKTEEAIYWLEQAADPSKNKTDSLKLSQELLHSHYYFDSNQSKKALKLATSAYQNGNIQLGCYLASQYGNPLDKNFDLQKSFDITTKIISENGASTQTSSCYSSLAFMYQRGDYVAKDILKYIELTEKIFNEIYDKKNDLFSVRIAESYMEDLHDFENAQKWYQITYDLTKNLKYLTRVDEYKKTLPIFDEARATKKQEVFPIIKNLSSAEQITSVLETKKYYFLATDQKAIFMYDKKTLSLIKELRGWIGSGIAGITIQMAFDETREYLYCSGVNSGSDGSKNESIRVFDINTGKIVKIINNPKSMKTMFLNISQDGQYLIAVNEPNRLQIIDTESNAVQTYDYTNIVKFTQANIVKVNDDYIVNALGNDGYLYSFSINQKRRIAKELFRNQTKFKEFNFQHAQRISPQTITNQIIKVQLHNHILYVNTQNSSRDYSFDLNTLNLSTDNLNTKQQTNSASSISINPKNGNHTLEIYRNNKKISSLEFLFVKVLSHHVIQNKYIIVATDDASAMYIFNLQGKAIACLTGFLSLQKNIHYENGYLITYGADNVIHIWSLDDLDKIDQLKESYDPTIVQGAFKQLGGDIRVMADINSYDEDFDKYAESMMQSMNLTFKPTKEQMVSFAKMFLAKKEEIYPLASLFVANNDWIVFDHNGYFASTENGNNLIRYHQNQGIDKEAKIIDNSQIFEKFYRPDIIKKKLAKENVFTDIDVETTIKTITPPLVEIVSTKNKDARNIDLTYKICDQGNGVYDPVLLINGITYAAKTTRGFSIETPQKLNEPCQSYKNTITLNNGINTIYVQSADASNTITSVSKPIELKANYVIKEKPNLYFISLAVKEYQNNDLSLKYSVNDAIALNKKFDEKSNNIFDQIFSYNLHDTNATYQNMDHLFTELSGKIQPQDSVVLFISGHGTTSEKDGLYYFLPYDITSATYESLITKGISINQIKAQFSKLYAQNSLILIDTCNSGGIVENLEAMMIGNRLSKDNKRNFIVASSKTQYALEGYKNHGIFSYALLDAFENAYFGNKKTLTTTNLAGYVELEVPRISMDSFHYEQTPQKFLFGSPFDIGSK
jgi:TPR repeat protein